MALTKASLVDLNSAELILDLNADTSIRANTDDTVDFKIAGNVEVKMTATGLTPGASDGNALGTAALEWSDLFLADGAVINFGDDQDVSLTHVADTGILLSSTDKLMFNDASQFIQGASATVLDIAATDEIELTATLIDVVGNLAVSGTIIGAGALTAATSITVGSAVLTEAELETLDGVTVGTAIASKVVTTDANIDTTGQRNLTISGELDAATGDFSGDVDIDGTANLDVVDIDGATQIDAIVTVGVDDTGYDVKFFGATSGSHLLWDESADDLILAGAAGLILPDGKLTLGSTAVTSTAAELNLIDGGASTGTTAVADADGILTNDGGTMRLTTAATFKTYFQEGISTAYDDLTAGDAAVLITTSSGDITIDAAANDSDIILRGTDGNQDTTFLTIDGSAAGAATFNSTVTATGFVGPLTGNVTGNTSGTALTVTQAAQSAITSVGTLTALTVDDVAVDGKVITMTGSSGDTFVTTVAANGATSLVTTDAAAAAAHLTITADGTVDIDSAGVLTLDSGAAINIEPASGSAILLDGTISIDAGVVTGATSVTSTAFVGNLTGTVATATQNSITTATGLVSVGALDSGSITSGFTSIDVGAGAITTTGALSSGALTATGAVNLNGGAFTFNEAGADLDFRVETSGNANAFFVDGGTDMVYFGAGSGAAFDAYGGEISVQIHGAGTAPYTGLGIIGNTNDADAGVLILGKSRGTSVLATTIVQDGDQLGRIDFQGMDGTDLETGATILAVVDGTPGANDMPAELIFKTTADGADSSTQRMVIKSDGSVGIAEDAPAAKLHVLNSAAGPFLTAANATAIFSGSVDVGKGGAIGFDFGSGHTNYPVGIGYAVTSQTGSTKGDLVFGTRGGTTDAVCSERMRIDSNANIRHCMEAFGSTSGTTNYGISFEQNGGSPFVQHFTNGTGNTNSYIFGNDNGVVGSIKTNGSATAFNTSSDYRLKENVDYDWDATTRLKQLKPARFNFIADDTNTLVDGFIAHEAATVVPECVSGAKDAMTTAILYTDEDDETQGDTPTKSVGDVKTASVPDMQGIDQSKLVPLLVKTLQEAITKIETLETKVQALEDA